MHRVLVLLCACALWSAACGDGDASPAAPAEATSDAATSASTTTPTTTGPTFTSTTTTTGPSSTTTTTTTAPTATSTTTTGGQGGGPPDANLEALQRFLAVAPADDAPFYMVNLIRYRDDAVYPDGRVTDLSGEEADSIYGEFMRTTKLPEIGAEIVYVGDVERDLVGGTAFDRVAVVRYPSRAGFAAMIQDPVFREMNIHKQAGLADTVVMATSRIEIPTLPTLEDPPHPATADDPPFVFVHVFDYRDTAEYREGDPDADADRPGRDAVALYSENAARVALPLGVRPLAWFEVEATIIGPPDRWEEVRLNFFPSHATFAALTSDPTWAAGTHHRIAGLESTYAIQTLPRINELNGVVS